MYRLENTCFFNSFETMLYCSAMYYLFLMAYTFHYFIRSIVDNVISKLPVIPSFFLVSTALFSTWDYSFSTLLSIPRVFLMGTASMPQFFPKLLKVFKNQQVFLNKSADAGAFTGYYGCRREQVLQKQGQMRAYSTHSLIILHCYVRRKSFLHMILP
jgi:hypothetical protein